MARNLHSKTLSFEEIKKILLKKYGDKDLNKYVIPQEEIDKSAERIKFEMKRFYDATSPNYQDRLWDQPCTI